MISENVDLNCILEEEQEYTDINGLNSDTNSIDINQIYDISDDEKEESIGDSSSEIIDNKSFFNNFSYTECLQPSNNNSTQNINDSNYINKIFPLIYDNFTPNKELEQYQPDKFKIQNNIIEQQPNELLIVYCENYNPNTIIKPNIVISEFLNDCSDDNKTLLRKKRQNLIHEEQENLNEFGLKMREQFRLKDYQLEILRFMINVEKNLKCGLKGGMISLEMGLGKTLISLTYALIKWDENRIPTLIVCPKNIMNNWKKEIDKFYGSEICPYLVFNKDNTNSTKYEGMSYEEIMKYKIVFVSYNRVAYLAKNFDKFSNLLIKSSYRKLGCRHRENIDKIDISKSKGADLLFDVCWNSIICDESHTFAKHLSQTALSMMTLLANYKWCLTGTPIRNYSTDLFSQMRFLGLENVETVKEFKKEFHRQNLKEFIIFKSYSDCGVQLPNKFFQLCKLEFTESEKEIYDLFLHQAQDSFGDLLAIKKKTHIFTLILKMRLICLSPHLLTKMKNSKLPKENTNCNNWKVAEDIISKDEKLNKWLHDIRGSAGIYSTKMTKLFEIINSIPDNEKIVVYSMFKISNIVIEETLKELYPHIKYLILNGDSKCQDRYEIIEKFKTDPSFKIMFITYKIGGEGINLVEAKHVILLEGWWNYCVLDQAISRVFRIGQFTDIKIWKIIFKNSIEEKMEMICLKKQQSIKEFFLDENNIPSIPDEILKELLMN